MVILFINMLVLDIRSWMHVNYDGNTNINHLLALNFIILDFNLARCSRVAFLLVTT
jgi:hypothetical protein